MLLNDKIESQFRIDVNQKKALTRLGISLVRDLLYYFPSRYTDISEFRHIQTLKDGEQATIIGIISNLQIKKGFKSKIPMGQATISDLTGKINIVWFHQPYLAKMLKEGSTVRVTGKVSESKTYGLTLTNPEINKEDILPIDLHDSLFQKNESGDQYGYPIYPETKGISSKWMYHAINKILKSDCVKNIPDYLDKEILNKYKLPSLHTALVWVHSPLKKEHAEIARKRFAFEEVFFIQLARQQERKKYEELYSYKLIVKDSDIKDFVSRFPFKPTQSQSSTIHTILEDLKKDKPMSRLVEGDVGSGKTFVAATIAYAVIKNRPVGQSFGNLQVAYMAPTEVLATQLFENFTQYFEHTGVSIALITSSGCRKFPSKSGGWKDGQQIKTWTQISKNQLLKWIKNGEIPIVIGTHSLISKSVEFEDLGLVVIDEQHRFGTNQRMKLAKKEGHSPHYLSMTATPIPRTLALTIYGDLDLSIIDEMPAGRKKVITEIVGENKRLDAYAKIKKELEEGRQLYIICPKIDDGLDEEDKIKLDVKSVTGEAKRLQKDIFPNYRIDIMHSKMSKQKKDQVMKEFAEHKIDILVSTSVIEVGVNIPNSTVIVIEGAERFGLAQLHQLRGRVIRSNHQSYCYLFADAKTDKTLDRLKALTKASNGFELAELDLSLRGAGLLGGDKQWGITDLGMEAMKNIKMVEAARTEAINIIQDDIDLKNSPLLAKTLVNKNIKLHFE
ncbi:MAG: ATP-dependent DNA helicase RecG [Candidatus Nomurabacteria bacterium]|nr:ATP-dependent DNA helicase RecG [Candidatus Nomurabacteria bacterium]